MIACMSAAAGTERSVRGVFPHEASPVSKPASSDPVLYGGQAVIEGVMMRSPKHASVAVRRADGSIETTVRSAEPWLNRHPFLNRPLLRGVFALFDALKIGVWGLRWSAERAALDVEPEKPSEPNKATDAAIVGTMLVGLALGVALFIALPTLIAGWIPHNLSHAARNILEGIARLTIFFLYLALIGRMEGIHRVFAFHGAEHRVINSYEAGAELTPEACRPYPVTHPRCGTSFAIFVLILATISHTFLGGQVWWARIAVRLALLPLVAAVSYEVLRFSAKYPESALAKLVTWPGICFQSLTTREPDSEQVEVAIVSLQTAMSADEAATA